MLAAGDRVPDVVVQDDQGQEISLRALQGLPYILYFYPADDTRGCTREACGFRDHFADFKQAGIEVFGVSPDSVESHAKFRLKYHLPFRLLADPRHELAQAFGVWGTKSFLGMKSIGVLRTTFVIGADGTVQRVYPKVKPDQHAAAILKDLGLAPQQR